MSKTIDVTIKGFEGRVTFFQPLNMEQVVSIEDSQDAAAEDAPPSVFLTKLNEINEVKDEKGEILKVQWSSRQDKFFIAPICKCVEKWELVNFPEKVTPETFPMSPRPQSTQLISFLFNELAKVYSGDLDVPNES